MILLCETLQFVQKIPGEFQNGFTCLFHYEIADRRVSAVLCVHSLGVEHCLERIRCHGVVVGVYELLARRQSIFYSHIVLDECVL